MRARRAGAIGRAVIAMATLAVLTVGLPIALLRFGGSPIPSHVPTLHHIAAVLGHKDNGSLFIGAVREISWLAWLAFTIAVLAEAQAALRGRKAPRLHMAGLQGAAGRLVAVASLAFAAPAAVSLAASPAMAATVQPAKPAAPQGASTYAAVVHESHAMTTRAGELPVVVVHPGDCLWTIAEHYLGAGDRYSEIVSLNIGHEVASGQVFTDPSLILPGWHLRLPADAHGDTAAHGSGGGQQHGGHRTSDPRYSGSHGAAHQGGSQHGSSQHGASHNGAGHHGAGHHGASDRGTGTGSAGSGSPGTQGEAGAPGGQPQAAGSSGLPGHAVHRQDAAEQVALFTLGVLAGAALASLERLRHRQRQHRRPGRRIALPVDEESARIERKLRSAVPPAPPASLRDALVELSEGVAASGDPLPPIVGIHLTSGAMDVLLSSPAAGPPPEPFTIAPARQAMCWTAELHGPRTDTAITPPDPGEVGDLLPGLFTAGATDAGGYLLLDLEAMRVTCCDGPEELTDRLLVTAATELASSRWSGWYELVLAGCDELDVLGRAERCADLDEALELLETRAATVARRLDGDAQADVRARRMEDPEDEDWGLTLLVSRIAPTPEQMSRLLNVTDGPGGIAALVAGDIQGADGELSPALFQLTDDPERPGEIMATITLAYLGPQHQITVWPQTLTISEYEALAGIFATAASTSDVAPYAAPYDLDGPPWLRLAAAPVAPILDEDEYEDELEALARPVSGPLPAMDWDDPSGEWEFQPPTSSGRHARPAGEPEGRRGPWTDEPDFGEEGRDRAKAPGRRASRPAELAVKVLGSFEISGSAESLAPKQAELVLALALSGSAGLSSSAMCALLGADEDHPRPPDAVRQLITRTRRRLGRAPDGQEYLVHLGSGIYVPHEDIRLDWTRFGELAQRGRANRDVADLRAAMALVRGQPFADCYHWWIEVPLIETMRAEIVDTAELLAQLELAAGDPRGAARAARAGLAAETAAEQLWRALMRAEHEARNPAGVAAAWSGCLDAITQIAPGGEPHPETERLYRQLSSGQQGRHPIPAGLR